MASQAAVDALLTDYYATSDAWSVRKSVERSPAAPGCMRRRAAPIADRDRGYVCTLSALVLKGATGSRVPRRRCAHPSRLRRRRDRNRC